MKKSHRLFYLGLLIFFGVYVWLSIQAPQPPSNPYHLTQTQRYLLNATIFVPILFIWLCALFGALHLTTYAKVVRHTPDGQGMYPLAIGVNLIVTYLLFSSVLSVVRSYVTGLGLTQYMPTLIITTNLLYTSFYLVAFFLMYVGSKKLLSFYKDAHANAELVGLLFLFLAVFMYFFLEAVFTNSSRSLAVSQTGTASYYLKDSLIVLLIVIPSFVTWALGILTFANIRALSQRATGIVYKKGVLQIVWGLILIIFSAMITQGFGAIGADRLLALKLNGILIIIYLLLCMLALGYYLLARGARMLTSIEEA